MPLDATAPSDPQKSGLPELDISLTDISSKIPNEVKESMLLASQFGGAAVASGLANDLLRSEAFNAAMRNPLEATWWERNGSASTSETFYQTRCSLQSRVFGLDRAREDLTVARGELRQGVEAIRSSNPISLSAAKALKIESRALYNQAEALLHIVNAAEDSVTKHIGHALRYRTVPNSLDVRLALEAYETAVNNGGFYTRGGQLRNILLTKVDSLALEARSREIPLKVFQLLEDLEGLTAETIRRSLGTRDQVNRGSKFIIDDSPLGTALLKQADLAKTKQDLSEKVVLAESEIASQRLSHNPSLTNTSKFLSVISGRFLAAAGLAVGSMAAGVGADLALSKLLGSEAPILDGRNGGTRLAIDGCLVPSVIMSDLPAKIRFPLAAAAFAAGRMAPLMPTNDIIKPNHVDSFLIPPAVMSPLGGKYKAAAIAASIGIGRVANYLTG